MSSGDVDVLVLGWDWAPLVLGLELEIGLGIAPDGGVNWGSSGSTGGALRRNVVTLAGAIDCK